jgi:hypothetical protein
MSLLTGPPDSTGGCQSALVDKLGVTLSQYHIAYHPGMNNMPVETAVLRRQSHPIIASLPRQHSPPLVTEVKNRSHHGAEARVRVRFRLCRICVG